MNLSARVLQGVTGIQSFGADVDNPTIARYQPGGDLYGTVNRTYGPDAADRMATAAASGSRAQLNSRMAELRGAPVQTGSTSTIGNFFTQIRTDPLRAPIAAALGQGSSGPGLGANTTGNLIKTVTFVALVGLALYGYNSVKRK